MLRLGTGQDGALWISNVFVAHAMTLHMGGSLLVKGRMMCPASQVEGLCGAVHS